MACRRLRYKNDTVVLITFDEGGGYYDSGYVQPLDFFGDGTRIPLIVVGPFLKPGHISHTLRGSRFDPQVHRTQLEFAAGYQAQPRQLPEPLLAGFHQPLRTAEQPGYQRPLRLLRLRQVKVVFTSKI